MKLKIPQNLAIIDDDPTILGIAKKHLERSPYFNIFTFSDPEQAISDIQKHKILFVITDINMPKVQGDELISRLRALPFGVTSAVISGTDNFTTALRCFNLGADIYTKPVTKEKYGKIISRFRERIFIWNSSIENVLKNKEENRKLRALNEVTEEARSEQSLLSDKVVLLVDDDPDLLAFTGNHLKKHFRVIVKESGAEAVKELKNADILVTDINLPGMDGFEIIAQAERDKLPRLPVIITSGFLDQDLEVPSQVSKIFTKPYSMNDLIHSIKKTLDRAS